MLRGAFLAAYLLCVVSNAQADLGRDDQWAFIPESAEHGARAELRGDHPEGVPSLLIVQIECSADRTLTFRYDLSPYLDELDAGQLEEPMGLVAGNWGSERNLPLVTRRIGNELEGVLALTSANVAAIRDAPTFYIYAPNQSGDAWVAGRAPALRQLVMECWSAPVR